MDAKERTLKRLEAKLDKLLTLIANGGANPKLYSIGEASKVTSLSPTTLRRKISRGEIGTVQISDKRVGIPHSEIIRLQTR